MSNYLTITFADKSIRKINKINITTIFIDVKESKVYIWTIDRSMSFTINDLPSVDDFLTLIEELKAL